MVAIAAVNPAQVLAKATMGAAELLGLKGPALSRILGISEATISRIQAGARGVDPASKEGELAILLIRVFRSLDALVGNDDAKRLAWMTSVNRALGGTPAQLIERTEGLVATLNYLDGMRARA
ncbi:MAG: antitoxin Xre/MbcA/ParS toxin-binding domain-containing protein [Aquabacterium sp.]